MKNRLPLPLCLFACVCLFGCRSHTTPDLMRGAAAQGGAQASPALAVSESTRSAAAALLGSLSEDQRAKAVFPIDAPLRKDWHFIPRQRKGVMLGELDNDQKTRVHALMQTALSDSGYLKATDIIWLESVLYEMSGQSPGRDPGNYALQLFGDPADKQAAWGWRLEGHHLSLNLTYAPEGIGVTPLFFGTNPAVVQDGPLAGKRILADAHKLAVELAKSMNVDQRMKMILDQKPRDVVTGPGREASLGEPVGISMGDMTEEQQLRFADLLMAHMADFEVGHWHLLTDRINPQTEPRSSLYHLSWAGPIDSEQPFYYRIHNDSFLIEYSCQGKNHVHCVVHDLADPLQEDLLKKHFEQHEH